MRLLEQRLSASRSKPFIIPVWFNPWRYQKEEHLIIPFLKTIEFAIKRCSEEIKKEKGENDPLLSGLRTIWEKIKDVSSAIAYGTTFEAKLGDFGITFDTSKASAREQELAQRREDEAKRLSEKLTSLYYDIVHELEGVIDEKSYRIAVFIDDLDRCLPENAVKLLEAMKLFLDIAGYLFVLGVDREVVKKGISYHYRFFEQRDEKEKDGLIISPENYLDKMIQLPLELPVIEQGMKKKFIEELLDNSQEFKEHADIIEAGVGDNPRTLKRFVNLLAFTVTLAETLKDNIINDKVAPTESNDHKELIRNYFIPILYIKWSTIVLRYPKEHNAIKGNKKRLIELQQLATKGVEKVGNIGEKKTETAVSTPEIDDALRKVLSKGEQFPNDDWLITRFIHLTESTVVSASDRAAGTATHHRFKPGDRVNIPKGKFLYGDDKVEKDIPYDYLMDVFPVTNRQYKEFIDEEKRNVPYRNEDWARPYNWDEDNRTYPKGLDDHPVVLVTFDDAVAYCEWRSKKEGTTDSKHYRLPTEEEWEKAARGTDGRVYPWGNDFDFRKLNCADYHVQKVLKDSDTWLREFREIFLEKNKEKALTSEVGRFSDGESPYYCLDMAGNVWEWTDSWYKDKTRVVRGGSWRDGGDICRCANRYWDDPIDWYGLLGFRCAMPL